MPPAVALLVCTVFVLFLLRIERKHAPKVSLALWIPTSWMLLIGSKPLGRWFQWGAGDGGSPLDQVFLSTLFCLGVLILASRNFPFSHATKENAWLMFLIGYMLASVLWSDIPFSSFKRWMRELVAVVMACVVLSERDPRQAMQSIFKRMIYILIPFSLILIKYFPVYGVAYRAMGGPMWVGVTLQKNALGRLCLMAAFFLIWTFVRRWQGRDIPAGKLQTFADVSVLLLALHLLTGPPGEDQYSATALVSLGAGMVTWLVLLRKKQYGKIIGANTLMLMTVLIIGFGVLQVFWGGSTVTGFTSNVGRDATLTGRTELWASLLPAVMQQPLVGSGIGGFWTPRNVDIYAFAEAHSGYLEVLLDFGFVGLVFVSMFLLSCSRKAQRILSHDYDWGSLWICFLVMAMVHNITESSINSFANGLTAILLFLAVSSTSATSSRTAKINAGMRQTSLTVRQASN